MTLLYIYLSRRSIESSGSNQSLCTVMESKAIVYVMCTIVNLLALVTQETVFCVLHPKNSCDILWYI